MGAEEFVLPPLRHNMLMKGLPMTIGQLSSAAKVPTSTVRFYERRGLLKADARTAGNYRSYSPRTAERLKFIRAAQATGFSLKDIREMLALTYSDEPPCQEVASLIERRLEDVKQRLRELKRIDRTLSFALKSCCKGGPDWCNEIERLKGEASKPCTSPRCSTHKPLTLHQGSTSTLH
jgi:MerR family mercuric resistance operon transcriptional regulator